jgi:nucleoside-diphosphate-sugar epimerase
MNIRRVLILGAAGYLAGFIIERLRAGCDLTLADIVEPAGEAAAGLPFLRTDVTAAEEVARACEGQEAVVHLVALVRERFDKPPPLFADVMVRGTWNVAEACVQRGVKRLVNISSIVACGWPARVDRPYRVGDPAQFGARDLSYCLAKSLGERIGDAYHQAHGLSVIHLRPGVIAGDGLNPGPQPPGATDACACSASAGAAMSVHSAQPQDFWFVYVDPRDVAQAVECALQTNVARGCYNIVAGRDDALFDWRPARDEIGYQPQHNWPEIQT